MKAQSKIMSDLNLAKILYDKFETLIFTDNTHFVPVNAYYPGVVTFSDFLDIASDSFIHKNIVLTHKLPKNIELISLIEDLQIFATGCTFLWSKEKIISLSNDDVYKKLYLSERSMLFYKGNKNNIASVGGKIGIRPDSVLTIPEAEIVAVFNGKGKIIGFTLGNDVTAVDLEKENPLYQMQAKFYQSSVALLPMIKLGSELPLTNLYCRVFRGGELICETTYHSEKFNRKALRPGDTVILSADFLPIPLTNECEEI